MKLVDLLPEPAREFVVWWTPRRSKRRQISRGIVVVAILIGLLSDASYEALQLILLAGIYVELMMRRKASSQRASPDDLF